MNTPGRILPSEWIVNFFSHFQLDFPIPAFSSRIFLSEKSTLGRILHPVRAGKIRLSSSQPYLARFFMLAKVRQKKKIPGQIFSTGLWPA